MISFGFSLRIAMNIKSGEIIAATQTITAISDDTLNTKKTHEHEKKLTLNDTLNTKVHEHEKK